MSPRGFPPHPDPLPGGEGKSLRVARWALLLVSIAPFALSVVNPVWGDTPVYLRAVRSLLAGGVPYRDVTLEYPPYALPFFLLPSLASLSAVGYRSAFAVEMLLVDVAVKALLLSEGKRLLRGWRSLLPCALFALDGWLQEYLYLKRFDLVPVALALGAVVLFGRRRGFGAGLLLALGAGTKVYPLLFLPPLAALAAREGRARRFLAGFAAGALPLLALAAVVPWWRFAAFHAGRGLQVESLLASLVWLGHHLFGLEAAPTWSTAWVDLAGPAARALVAPGKALFALATLASVGIATRVAAGKLAAPPLTPTLSRGDPSTSGLRPYAQGERAATGVSTPALARLLLLPLAAFVAWNTVLSPQYVLWAWSLGALAFIEPPFAAGVALVVAAVLSPIIYPSADYHTGFALWRTLVLVARNGALVAAWALLARDAWRRQTPRSVKLP